MIVAADDEKEHDSIMKKVMCRARECGVKFNPKKLQYKVAQVNYLGFVFSQKGLTPNEAHVKAIKQVPAPTNKKLLQKFLGVITFLHKFIPNMSHICAPLRELLKKDVQWKWTPDQQKAFDSLKILISNAPTLKYFDANQSIVLQTDASKDGLGACLLQNDQPVAFLSRSLTDSEKKYSMIEKELLGICYAVSKFHQFIYGHKIVIQTDHKPLVNISQKDIHKSTSRIQRLLLKLLNYDLTITYLPGEYMYISDFLSRNFLNEPVIDDPAMTDIVHAVMMSDYLPISEEKLKILKKETEKDSVLSKVSKFIINGWTHKEPMNYKIKHYYKLRDQLYVKNNIIFFNDKVVIPSSMYNEMLKQVHGDAHLGIVKSKKRGRSLLYWPNMSSMIHEYVQKCNICQKYQRSCSKEPLINNVLPKYPFAKISLDIAEYGGKSYLILVDFLSKWLDIISIKNKSIEQIISKLKLIFSQLGIPKEILCDNNPFNSHKFKEFASSFGFNIIHCSPYHHQSNGLCEKAVGIAKNIIKKAESKDNILTALLEYRVTPVSGTNFSPSEILMGRMLRSKLPCSSVKLKPKLVYMEARKEMEGQQSISKQYYDKRTKIKEPFKKNDNVILQNPLNKLWEPGTVVVVKDTPRSYKVLTENCKVYSRNSIHMRDTEIQPEMKGDVMDEPIVESKNKIVTDMPNIAPPEPNDTHICNDNQLRTRSGRVVQKPVRFRT